MAELLSSRILKIASKCIRSEGMPSVFPEDYKRRVTKEQLEVARYANDTANAWGKALGNLYDGVFAMESEIAELRKQLEEARVIIEKLPKTENDWFHRGFAVACAAVARDHDMPSVASDIMQTNGITTEQLKAAGVDAADIKEISGRRGGKGR